MSDKEKAFKKLETEISKDIENAIKCAKQCGIMELLYFIYLLHNVRLISKFSNAENENPEKIQTYGNFIEESLKYIISLIVKFGTENIEEISNGNFFKTDICQVFLKHANYINSKYESTALFQLFDLTVYGERYQTVKIDMSSINENLEVKNLFNYFLRIDEDNHIKKSEKQNIESLLQNFTEENKCISHLFLEEFNITIEEFCWLIKDLLNQVTDKIKLNEDKFVKLPNGNIDVLHQITYLNFSVCYTFDKSELISQYDSRFEKVISKLIFKPVSFDEKQLRFHQLSRQPLIDISELLIISPELLLDSIFINTHYSLIESADTKTEYIALKATNFLDKIANIANNFGYYEVDRELDLYEGKRQIGDIDIILKDDNGHYLLIEAKNHALPLDVYFKDVNKSKKHLEYLQNSWEKKVKKRVEHLQISSEEYSIPKHHKYIVVSLFPEIISHYSDILVFSLQEFEVWLKNAYQIESFNDFYKEYYESKEAKFSDEEFEQMQKDNIIFGRFGQE